jgi:hypothetical protein
VAYTSTNTSHNASTSNCVEFTDVDFTGDEATIIVPGS